MGIRYNFDMAPPRRMPKSLSKEPDSTPINKGKEALPKVPEANLPKRDLLSEGVYSTQAQFIQSDRRVQAAERDYDVQRFAKRGEAQVKLREELHGGGHVGQVFRKLVKAGCDERWLENEIVASAHSSPWRSSQNPVGKRELQSLLVTSAILRRQAKKIGPLLPLLSGRLAFHDPHAAGALADAPVKLDELAKYLELAHKKSVDRVAYELVASRVIPSVIAEVRKQTGEPRFAELAILYGASYRREISAENLRTMEAQEKSRLRQLRKRSL